MKNVILILLIVFYNLGAQANSGEEVYKDRKINCAQCHGKDGMGMAKKKGDGSWGLSLMKGPRIAGLSNGVGTGSPWIEARRSHSFAVQ